jgi:hypothetical protein
MFEKECRSKKENNLSNTFRYLGALICTVRLTLREVVVRLECMCLCFSQPENHLLSLPPIFYQRLSSQQEAEHAAATNMQTHVAVSKSVIRCSIDQQLVVRTLSGAHSLGLSRTLSESALVIYMGGAYSTEARQ